MTILAECPPFADWHQAAAGWEPFPWQERIASLAADGEWPDQIGVPTGLGKTGCVVAAVWALAAQAHRPPAERTVPTRIWWVVNRRILVDDTFALAVRIAELLVNPDNLSHDVPDGLRPAVAAVADRLRAVAGDPHGMPLQALRLRGGDAHNRPNHPAQPAIICATIPMYGSRMLFRGYGSSRSMRPIDAALAFTDSLILVDEAHLAVHLRALIGKASEEASHATVSLLPARRSAPQVVALTATADPHGDRFDLDSEDRSHPIIVERLKATKPVRVHEVASAHASKPATCGKALAEAVFELLGGWDKPGPARMIVFANTPDAAPRCGRTHPQDRPTRPASP